MKTYAFYNGTGQIKKMITTTKGIPFIEKNLPAGLQYVEVPHGVKTTTHDIMNGVAVKKAVPIIFKPKEIIKLPKPIITDLMVDGCITIVDLKRILRQLIRSDRIIIK
jgi:hypothetical protein